MRILREQNMLERHLPSVIYHEVYKYTKTMDPRQGTGVHLNSGATLQDETDVRTYTTIREREIFIDNLLVQVHFIIEMSRPALRHGSLTSLFQVALYLPS